MTAIAALLFWVGALVPISAPNTRYVEVALAVTRHFPVEARQTMMCIGYWETQQEPYSNDLVGAAGEVSWLQIHPIHFGRFNRERLRADVNYAAWAGRQLYDESGLSPWTTYWAFCRK